MEWELRYERDGFSVEAAFKKKRKLPDDHWFWDEPPEVPGAAFFYGAYCDLGSCRHPDGPIPWTACREWSRDRGLRPDIANTVWIVVSRMDSAERRWRIEQIKSEAEGG